MVDYAKIRTPSIQTTENQISESALFYKNARINLNKKGSQRK